MSFSYQISEIKDEDKTSIANFIAENWGSHLTVSKGKVHDTTTLPGFIYRNGKNISGLITYNIVNDECEIATLDSKTGNKGLGTKLIELVIDKARENNCRRVWLITTNDNTHAIRFYQRRGFEWVGFHKDAMEVSRKLKPQIPELGDDNIPIKHEIEFEYRID